MQPFKTLKKNLAIEKIVKNKKYNSNNYLKKILDYEWLYCQTTQTMQYMYTHNQFYEK